MISRIRNRITSAHVIAATALFVALGGTAIAATFGKNSVKSRHVVDNKLKSKDLKDGKGVKSEDVIDNSLSSDDLANEARGAFGQVDPVGGLLTNARNVASVSHPSQGVYCIVPAGEIDLKAAVLVVTPDHEKSGTSAADEKVAVAEWDSVVDACPANSMEVNTFLLEADATDNDTGAGDEPGDNLEPADVGFSFSIP